MSREQKGERHDEKTFGKEIGKDIISNKKTYLLIKAMQLANGENKTALQKWLKQKEFDASEKVAAIQQVYYNLKIKELTQQVIDANFKAAVQ